MVESRTVASVMLIAGALLFSSWQRQTASPVATFVEIRPSLYRLNYQWNIYIGAPVPVATWLLEISPNAWILIDAGTPNADNQRAILQGLQTTLSSADDTLRLVLVTHAHLDHTGALGKVLEAYPSVKVAFHAREEPYLVGGGHYADLDGDNAFFNTWRRIRPALAVNSTLVPASRALQFKGESGDVADIFTYTNWIEKGVLTYHAVPGHTPGQIAFFHKPTGSVITADSFVHLSSWWPLSNTKDLRPGIPFRLVTPRIELTKASQKKLFELSGAKTFFPSHDHGNGISAQEVQEYLMA